MKTIKHLKSMIAEPASKKWFAKHGTPHSEAKEKAMKRIVNAGTGRRLTKAEQKFKTKDWPIMQKGYKPKDTFSELAYTLLRGKNK